jgi:hypothetical protein
MRVSFILLMTFFVCCSDDKNQIPADLITGVWSLTHYSPGFAQQEYYQSGDILWEFNSRNKLIVKINVDLSESKMPIVTDGQYSFALNNEEIELKDVEYDYTIVDNILTISDHPEVDGPQIKFIRIK